MCLDTQSHEMSPGRPLGVDKYQQDLQTQYFEYTKQVSERYKDAKSAASMAMLLIF